MKKTAEISAKSAGPTLAEMMASLREVDGESWGMYAFSRDILRDRIPADRKPEMIASSIRCGEEYAQRVQRETGESTPDGIAAYYGLHVTSASLPMTDRRVLFASYTPPDDIVILREPLEKYSAMLAGLRAEDSARLPTEAEVRSVLLGHELFHYVEEQHSEEIYTRTEKIRLWKILGLENNSAIRALGEIASMAFSKELNRIAYFPFILDVLLFFGYHEESARSIYRNIMDMDAGQKRSRE